MLARLRGVLLKHYAPNGDFPVGPLDEEIRRAGRIGTSSEDAIEKVLSVTYGEDTCFLALSLLYQERNWGTLTFSIDHLFPRDAFKKMPDELKELRDDIGNLALVIDGENSAKQHRPLADWLATRSPEYLKRHCIPTDSSLWVTEKYEEFLIERRKLLRATLQQVLSDV
jgi:hypothetical protein